MVDDSDDKQSKLAGRLVGDLLKKAVTIGAGAYAGAEEAVAKTLNTVTIPKEFLKDAVESLFDAYTIQVQAEIKLVPKRKTPSEKVASSTEKGPLKGEEIKNEKEI